MRKCLKQVKIHGFWVLLKLNPWRSLHNRVKISLGIAVRPTSSQPAVIVNVVALALEEELDWRDPDHGQDHLAHPAPVMMARKRRKTRRKRRVDSVSYRNSLTNVKNCNRLFSCQKASTAIWCKIIVLVRVWSAKYGTQTSLAPGANTPFLRVW